MCRAGVQAELSPESLNRMTLHSCRGLDITKLNKNAVELQYSIWYFNLGECSVVWGG